MTGSVMADAARETVASLWYSRATGLTWRRITTSENETLKMSTNEKPPEAKPIATVPRVVLDAIGGRSPAVLLSAATAAKQAQRHPDVRSEDYARVQHLLDEGELFHKRDRELNGFVEADGRLWRVAIKTARDGAETYLTTFHIAKPRDLASARRRLERIERGVK